MEIIIEKGESTTTKKDLKLNAALVGCTFNKVCLDKNDLDSLIKLPSDELYATLNSWAMRSTIN